MNFKKIVATVLAATSVFAVAGATTACAPQGEKLKVKQIELTQEDYAFAIRKGNSDLLNTVNGLIADWKDDGSLNTLINSYFEGDPSFTYTNKTNAPESDDFVMATNAAFPPFEYKKGNAFTGIDVQIASLIATHLGKDLFVFDMKFDSIIASVQNDESDIGMAGMTVTATRQQQVDFATSYYTSAQVITVLESDTTFDACVTAADVEAILATKDESYIIGTQNGTTGYMYSKGDVDFEYDGFTNLTTNGYTTGALAMQDLVNKRINAVILDLQPSLMIAQSINK